MKNIKKGNSIKEMDGEKRRGNLVAGWVYVIFAGLFLLLQAQDVFATHAAGSDLTYACLGGNQIEVTFYRQPS